MEKPLLVCCVCGKPTRHTYMGERRPKFCKYGLEQIYACDTCQTARRWGVIEHHVEEG